MRPLIIDFETKQKIKSVIEYAEQNRIDHFQMIEIEAGILPPVGDNPNHCVSIFSGFRVVFSIEEHPIGWCRHFSVSVNADEKLPSIPATELLLQEFGFGENKSIHDFDNVWLEDEYIVNVIQLIEEKDEF